MKLKKLLCAGILLAPLAVLAQGYPAKTVRIMVGANAGGGTDIIARLLAEKFADGLKGTFVVENKPGASNTIAADLTAKAPADGYTLLVATNTGQAIAPHLMKLNFDPIKDLAPVGLVVTVPNVLVVGPTVTATNVKELVAQMKAAGITKILKKPTTTTHIKTWLSVLLHEKNASNNLHNSQRSKHGRSTVWFRTRDSKVFAYRCSYSRD